MERKEKIAVIIWGLAVLYALFASLYTTLFGCDCPAVTVMGDCHTVHLPEILGTIGWMLLVPAGMWLFRQRKEILQVFGTYIGAMLACSALWLIEDVGRALSEDFAFRHSWEGISSLLLFPLHGLKGFGLSDRVWLAVVLVWSIGLCVGSIFLERKYHPRAEKIRLTFVGVYKFVFVLLGVLHLLVTAETLDLLIVSNPDRLPEVWYIIVTGLWLVVMVSGLRHFRHTGWMKGLAVLCLVRSIGLFFGGIGFLMENGWYLTPLLLLGCTSPMLLPVELFWNLLSCGPPYEVTCFMALVPELAVMITAYLLYRRDFPRETQDAALSAEERSLT